MPDTTDNRNAPEERCPRGPVALYTTFRAEGVCAGAMLEITGLGMFRAYLNGVRVGEDYLTPGCNDYDAYVRVFTYPVGALLRAGEDNLLTVWLGDGWYRGRYGIDKAEASGGCVWGGTCCRRSCIFRTAPAARGYRLSRRPT